jgi:hypothetical protein
MWGWKSEKKSFVSFEQVRHTHAQYTLEKMNDLVVTQPVVHSLLSFYRFTVITHVLFL